MASEASREKPKVSSVQSLVELDGSPILEFSFLLDSSFPFDCFSLDFSFWYVFESVSESSFASFEASFVT